MQTSYVGKTCPYCQFPIKQGSGGVLCPGCQVPHHRTCWEENKGCTTFGCKETTFKTPVQHRVDIPSEVQSNFQATSNSSGLNTSLVVALVISLLIIIVLFVRLTAEQQANESSQSPSIQPSQQANQQTNSQMTQQPVEVIYYVITEPGVNLFIRKSPGRNNKKDSDIITRVPRGTQFTVTNNHGNSVKKDGYTWWEIRVVQSGITGWVAAEFISTNSRDVRK